MTAVLSRSQEGRTDEVGGSSTTTPIPSRWDWRNWPVVIKLAAVLLVPTIVALVAGILRIVDQAGAAPGYERISQIVHLQQQLSDLVGQLGRERDLATAYVATGRLGDHRNLDAQFRTVDTGLRGIVGAAGQVAGVLLTYASGWTMDQTYTRAVSGANAGRIATITFVVASCFVMTNRPISGTGLSIPIPTFAYFPLVKLNPSWQLSQRALFEKNTSMPRFWLSFRALSSPALKRS